MIVAPGFVDWTPYRDTFARQLTRAIGRPVTIEGNVAFVLVPRPALEAGRVRVQDGADAVTVAGVKASLGFLPLLKGELYFRDLRLDEAVGTITVDLPWADTPAMGGSGAPAPPSPRPVSIDIDRVAFNGGDLTLRLRNGDSLLRLQSMDLAFFGEGRDRFRLEGDLLLNGQPMTLDAQIGAQGGDGVRPVSVSARVPAAQASLAVSGRTSFAKQTFDGTVSLKAEQGAALLSSLGLAVNERPALARPFTLAAKTTIDGAGIALTGVTLDAGGAIAKGAVDWRRARTPQLAVRLDFAPFALEDWRSVPTAAAAPPSAATVSAPPAPAAEPSASRLTANIDLRFPALSFRGQGLRDGSITASLANGELTISDMSLTLPGTTRVNGFGLVALGQSAPSLDGIVSLQTFDARRFFGWLGANVNEVPPGRLGSASFQAAVQGTLNFLELNDIEGALDTARVAGRLSFAPRARPFVGVDLRLENVNLDSYRGPTVPAPVSAPPPPAPAKPEVYGVTPSGAAYAGLGNFDAEVHFEASGVTAGGLPGGRLGLDLGLKDGTLDIRTASFEKIAGTTAWFSGSVGGFGAALQFNNLQFDLAGEDIARLATLVGVNLDLALKSLGSASLTGTLNGSAVQADVTATLKAAGLTARATGQIMEIEKDPRFSGQIEAAHPRFSELMRATPYSWPANTRDPGAFALQARIVQDPGKTTVSDVRASVGRDHISGTAEISRVDGKAVVSASLADILLDLDRVLPQDTAPSPPPRASAAKAAEGPASPVAQAGVTWEFLKGWSGEISVAGPSFSARGLALQDFSGRIVAADDAAELADWQGKIFGAPGQLSFRIAATPEPSLQAQIAVNRADFRALVAALNGGRTNLKSSGTADLVVGFSMHGTSAAGFAQALSGSGTLKVSASETGGGLSAGLLGPLNAAAQLDVGSPGKPAPITFQTRLVAANGIVRLEDAEVSSRSHTGKFTGSLDLPRRQVDVSGTLVPRKAGEDALPISIKGAMDRPNIRLLPPPRN